MRKQFLRAGMASAATLTMLALSGGGVASAASISNTGPGSTNIIRGNVGDSSIYNTGPDSRVIIVNSGHGNFGGNFGNSSWWNGNVWNGWSQRCDCNHCWWVWTGNWNNSWNQWRQW